MIRPPGGAQLIPYPCSPLVFSAYSCVIHIYKEVIHKLIKSHPRVLGVVPITHYPTLVFSSDSAREGTLHPGDYALLYLDWYQVSTQSSLQLVGKTAIPVRQAALTNVGGWKRDLESVLKEPLDPHLEARQADIPYVVFLDPDR
jgi:hypothetical protein